MSCYPDLRDFFESFAARYMRTTEAGSEFTGEKEELETLGGFLVMGIVYCVESALTSADGDRPAIGESLDHFFDQYPRGSDVGAAFKITEEEMYGLGIFFARGFVGWLLKLDQDRGRFNGFGDVIRRQWSSAPGPLPRRLITRVMS